MKKARLQHRSYFRRSVAIALVIFGIYLAALAIWRAIDTWSNQAKQPPVVQLIDQMLVQKTDTRVLVLLLNSSEARIGGGFSGSVTTLTKDRGKFSVEPVQSVYYFDDMGVARFNADAAAGRKPPVEQPFLRDSNQNIEWSTNAKIMADRYEYATGKRIDSVIALTPDVLKSLLSYTGPITLSQYGKTLSAANFLEQVELEVESGIDKQQNSEPKSILGEAATAVISKLWSKNLIQLTSLYPTIQKLASQKSIVLWSRDQNLQQQVLQSQVGGEVKPADYDYLFIAEQNSVANKSTPYIQQKVVKKIKIGEDGKAVVDVTITRQHTSDYAGNFYNPWGKFNMFLIGENKSVIKMVLPQQVKLFGLSNNLRIQSDSEADLQFYQFVSDLLPLTRETYTFSYQLPFKYQMGDNLDVVSQVQKQIGRAAYDFELQIIAPPPYRLAAASVNKLSYKSDGNNLVVDYATAIDTDKIISLKYAKN
ncbi:DUF4012 domain-containing protein [Candidatus Saccharibacteria bacterium]|nr:DUF4012 domain-containing protein [Candidatus Saccharibacteria bacterium]